MITQFKEEQKFTQWWLWLIMICIGIIPIYGLYKQLILGEKFGDNPMSDSGLILFSILVFALIGLFSMMKLKTTIDETEIRMHFFPFVKKKINWSEVKKAEVVNYGFVGGWGIRLWTSYGTVYNVRGNKGLALELMNGKKLLIGTQKEDELKRIINKPVADKS